MKAPTVIILGAGASAPYGYPIGSGLRRSIIDTLSRTGTGKFQLLEEFGFSASDLKNFADNLNYSPIQSVDEYLRKHPKYNEIGRAAIAVTLIPFEDPSRLFNIESEWYYIFFRMIDSMFKSKNRNLSIVTFNYDRSLEFFLWKTIKHYYDINDREAIQLMSIINIVHVHGTLNQLPAQDIEHGREYGSVLSIDSLKKCIPDIKIINEDLKDSEAFNIARNLIENARYLFFGGFAYDEVNLERLGFLNNRYKSNFVEILGTTYGLSTSDEDKVKTILKPYATSYTPMRSTMNKSILRINHWI